LTFDAGPDPLYTPQVLEILHRAQVPATFCIVGLKGDLNAQLLPRLVDEGHEIGNHTFPHPNVAMIRPQLLSLALNATERLVESRLGRRSVLLRPPDAEDVEPETPEQVKPLLLTGDLGYYTYHQAPDHTPASTQLNVALLWLADEPGGSRALSGA